MPQPAAPTRKQETDASPWWAEIADKLADALATLIAAGVGFGASMWAERRAWQRRKAEEIRSEQLTKLLQTARHIEMCRRRLAQFQQLVQSAGNPSSGQDSDLLQVTAIRAAQDAAAFLAEKLTEIELQKLELRALRVGNAALDAITNSAEVIAKLVLALEQLGRRFDQANALKLSPDDIPIEALTMAALSSLEEG
jgi:hypothetical protein